MAPAFCELRIWWNRSVWKVLDSTDVPGRLGDISHRGILAELVVERILTSEGFPSLVFRCQTRGYI